MNKSLPYTLIDTAGQTTAVIDVFVPRLQQPTVAKPLMKKIKNIGQVCFIEKEKGLYRLQMMGNELSVNGSLAGAFYLSKKLNIKKFNISLSGLQKLAIYNNGSITFPKLIISSDNDEVGLDGIIYKLFPNFVKANINKIQKSGLRKLSIRYGASGFVYYQGQKIQPLIYVRATNTFVWETCCGSASIAYAMISNQKEIIQPSGQKVTISIKNKDVIYSCMCRMLR